MRARFGASACAVSYRPVDRHLRLRSLVLLPAMVLTAAAMHASSAFALSSDLRREGGVPGQQAVRQVVEVEEAVRPRRRAGRRNATSPRRGYRQVQRAGRARRRAVAVRAAREKPRVLEAGSRLAPVNATVDMVPLEQRSLVASHPLLPNAAMGDRDTTAAPVLGAEPASPRCRGVHASPLALAVASVAPDFSTSEPAMVDGAWPHCRGARNPQSSWRLTSLGSVNKAPGPSAVDADDRSSGWSIHWRASSGCLADPLRAVLKLVADVFGPLTVNSTCRSRQHNARVGGAPRSYHLTGNAVDFRVRDRYREVHGFLSRMRSVGGLTHYGSGVFHIDTGPRRSWAPNSWGRHNARGRRRRS
jgi:Peptidase M15